MVHSFAPVLEKHKGAVANVISLAGLHKQSPL
jgi:hypothetical protein